MKTNSWLGFSIFLLLAAGVLAFVLDHDRATVSTRQNHAPLITAHQPITYYGVAVRDDCHIMQGQVHRNERLTDILERYGVDERFVRQLKYIPRSMFDMRKIIAGKSYLMISRSDPTQTPRAFVYEPNDIEYVLMRFEDTLYVDRCQRNVDTLRRTVSGTIESSLYETISALGMSAELTNRVVDIFAWQLDFQHLNRGDRFRLVYDELEVDGKVVGIQQIGAAEFDHGDHAFYAFPFDQGEGLDYFDENGNSLRKALLKYPIEFTRISSRYSWHRFHPIQKVFKPHLGTDFAAPTGTPIRSVGDGVVLEAHYSTYNGNYVKIRHNATYTTQYLHMSKIASGIRPGVRVRQGQWIGNVGSTGLANGPHLCYRFWKNGVQVDALRVNLPPATPVKEEYKASFEETRDLWEKVIQGIEFPGQSQLAKAN